MIYLYRVTTLSFLAVVLLNSGLQTVCAQQKYSPNHPDVKAMVGRAVKALETANVPNSSQNRVLAALTIVEASKRYENVVPTDHPFVVEALRKIESDFETDSILNSDPVYYPALALILLCDVDPYKYRERINAIIKNIVERQQADGAYTYLHNDGLFRGDVSQTQYVGLALWVAHKHGFALPIETPQKALEWLLSVNLPNGGWSYEYENGRPTSKVTLSIQAAGASTVYLLSDFLQLNPKSSRRPSGKVDKKIAEELEFGTGLPPSVSVYVPPKENGGYDPIQKTSGPLVRFDIGKLNSVKRSANQFFNQNFEIEIRRWNNYYLYAFERYAFFREKAEGSVREIPDWYDQGVEMFLSKQLDSGMFPFSTSENEFYATCFGILFLVRSSEILVLPSGEGNLNGGLGLKSNVRLDLVDGKVQSFDVVKGLDDVLKLLESEDIDEEQYELIQLSLTKSITNISNNETRSQREQLNYLRGLVSDRSYFKRLIAIKILSRQQEMDNVPALIYALGDPDLRICAEAHNGLRLISRKLDSIQLPAKPGHGDYQKVKTEWTKWFLKIRPGAELLD